MSLLCLFLIKFSLSKLRCHLVSRQSYNVPVLVLFLITFSSKKGEVLSLLYTRVDTLTNALPCLVYHESNEANVILYFATLVITHKTL